MRCADRWMNTALQSALLCSLLSVRFRGLAEACWLASRNLALAADPGYWSPTEGAPSETSVDGAVRSALGAASALGYAPHHIVIMGRSIGSGPAVRAAATLSAAGTPPAALALQSAYTSVRDIARGVAGPVAAACLMDRWASVRSITGVTSPVFLVHGEVDPLIPAAHSIALRDAALRSPLVDLR